MGAGPGSLKTYFRMDHFNGGGSLVGYRFKPEVSQLLSRFKGGQIGPHKIEMASDSQHPVPASITEETPERPKNLLSPAATDPLTQQLLDNLDRDFGSDSDQKIRFLIGWLFSLNAERQHEIRYRLIFGSQIAALDHLNSAIDVPASELRSYYEIARSSLGQQNVPITFDAWLDFLLQAELVSAIGGQVSITRQGRDFLTYLSKNGIPRNKFY